MSLFRAQRPLFFSLSTFTKPRRCPVNLSRYQSTTSSHTKRIDRILSRLPRFLHPWTSSLRSAPGSNVVAFLILHEITAIVPLIGLAGLFHNMEWLPTYWTEARYIQDGTEKFGRYFARKGWFGFSREDMPSKDNGVRSLDTGENTGGEKVEAGKRWHVSGSSSRILVEVATAYAITKVFLPARILLSVWATPWFARVVVGRIGGGVGRLFSNKGVKGSATAGTVAVGAPAVGQHPKKSAGTKL